MSHGILVGCIYFVLGDQSRKYFWQALNPLAWMRLLNGSDTEELLIKESYFMGRDSMMMEMTKSVMNRPSGFGRS
jgi:hypothetical protein